MSYTKYIEQLDEQGFTVFPGFLDLKTTAAIRAHMDAMMPPIRTADDDPAINRVNILRHPIPGQIMADILNRPKLLDLAKQLVKARDIHDLRMLEQVLIRTDQSPPPYGPGGWHVDMAFLPKHYDATPRQTYYHMVHLCSTVKPGGGAFMIVPGSHKQTYAYTASVGDEGKLSDMRTKILGEANIDTDQGIEVPGNEGDLLVFNPMCAHSASKNNSLQPRYVYFASFMDDSANYLRQFLRDTNYRKGYPDDLVKNIPQDLQPLLEV
jgi:hypothetical protein